MLHCQNGYHITLVMYIDVHLMQLLHNYIKHYIYPFLHLQLEASGSVFRNDSHHSVSIDIDKPLCSYIGED